MSHELALMAVILLGFGGWGLWNYYFPRTFRMRTLTPKEVEEFKALWKRGTIQTMPLFMMDETQGKPPRRVSDLVDSISFAMNSNQRFIRQESSRNTEEEYNADKRRRDFDRGLQHAIFNSPSIRYAWETDEVWEKRTGGFKPKS